MRRFWKDFEPPLVTKYLKKWMEKMIDFLMDFGRFLRFEMVLGRRSGIPEGAPDEPRTVPDDSHMVPEEPWTVPRRRPISHSEATRPPGPNFGWILIDLDG